jgi:hypothetical protein
MRRIFIAIRVFFLVLFHGQIAAEVDEVLKKRKLPQPMATAELPRAEERPAKAKPTAAKTVGRSEAVTLLATLQREARLVDFVKEPLAGYSDAQIGAVARDVHRDCGAVLQRLFDLKPVVEQEEGAEIEVHSGFDAGRFHLTGNVVGEPPFHGRLAHHGWIAAACNLPAWTGSKESATIIAPVEVELPGPPSPLPPRAGEGS